METEAPARSLVSLELALEVAVDALTRSASEAVGDGRRAGVPSLLDQVDDARTARTGPGAAAPTHAGAPVRVDALDLLTEIERTVGKCSRPTLAERVRAWSGEQHSATDAEVLSAAVEQAEAWVERARHLLNPRPAWRLRGVPCPMCSEQVEAKTNSAGEEVLSPVLEVRPDEGLICVVCRAWWSSDVLAAMAEHVERQTEVETLAHDEL